VRDLADFFERLGRGEDIVEAEPVEVPVSAVFEQQKDKPSALAVIAAAAQEMAQRDALPPEMREQRAALLRVNADMIDRFVNEAGELSIARSRIEGEFEAGEEVCLVEDVVTSGGAAEQAVGALREAGLVCRTAICVVDREEGGADALARQAVRLVPIFRASDILPG